MRSFMTRNFAETLESYQRTERGPLTLVTMESIAFQLNDTFGKDIEAVVQKYKDLIDSGAKRKAIDGAKELRDELSKVINKRLGLKVSIITNDYIAATMPNLYVAENPMIEDVARWIYEAVPEAGGQDKLKKLKDGTVLGTVNTSTVKVSGWFSEQEAPVFIDFYALLNVCGMTVEEVTAIILHELGHVFEGIAFSANVNTTNQVLADIARHISNSDRGGDAKYIYNKVREVNPKMTMDIAEGLASNNKIVKNVALYRLIVGTTETLMSDKVYDRTSFEALADQFCTRFGYGQHLVSGLEVLEKDYPEYEMSKELFRGAIITMGVTAMLAVAGFAMLISGGGGAPFGGLLMFVTGMLFAAVYTSQSASGKPMTYDNIRDRYMRIRSQLVEIIKNQTVARPMRERALKQIEAIDKVISEKKVFVSFLEKWNNKIIPSARRASISIEFQQESEKMIANDLFISAHKLSSI